MVDMPPNQTNQSTYINLYVLSYANHVIFFFKVSFHGIMVRVLANDPGDLGSIPGRVLPKTQKIVLVATLLNTQP